MAGADEHLRRDEVFQALCPVPPSPSYHFGPGQDLQGDWMGLASVWPGDRDVGFNTRSIASPRGSKELLEVL